MNKTFLFVVAVSLLAVAVGSIHNLTPTQPPTQRPISAFDSRSSLSGLQLSAAEPGPLPSRKIEQVSSKLADDYKTVIRPLLVKYCAECHSPGDMAGLEFLADLSTSDVSKHRGLFSSVFEQIDTQAMPPRDFAQPTDRERRLVTDWLKTTLDLKPSDYARIAQYVVEVYEDKDGNLWFGSMNRGAARFDGEELTYFTEKDGLPINAVSSFAEDSEGNLYVGTQAGICKFNGKTFTRLGQAEGLPTPGRALPTAWSSVSSDRNGTVWVRVGQSLFQMENGVAKEFETPTVTENIESFAIVPGSTSFEMEDSEGNFWFATDGDGAYKFDGETFEHFTKTDGLCSNTVNRIMEDQQGNIWFACMQSYQPRPTGDGGLCRFDGTAFTYFPEIEGLSKNDIYTIEETSSGDIWIGGTGVGAYRYDGKSFTLFDETDRPHWTRYFGVQSIAEDRNGTLWFGFSGGLFRFNGKSFYNVSPDGPWEDVPKAMATFLAAGEMDPRMIHAQTQVALTAIANGDLPRATSVLGDLKRDEPWEFTVQEATINLLGYQLVWASELDLAIEVFKLNTLLYPSEYNTFDSLAEAFWRNGDEQLAIENFEKSIELNAGNTTAKNSIKEIIARQKYENLLVAPEDWLQEVLVVPTSFAPTMSITGIEHLRLPPAFRQPESDWFISYLFAIELTEPSELSEKRIGEELLTYFRGLAEGGTDQKGQKINTERFSIEPQRPNATEAEDEFVYVLNWQEPFVGGTALKQNLRVKIISGKNEHGILFVCGSPQPFNSDVWKKLVEVRTDFENRQFHKD